MSTKSDGLRQIPSVGPRIERDLRDLGIHQVAELENADPQALYDRLCLQRGMHLDRCLLYVFRCADYFAGSTDHDPGLLERWNWKEATPLI